jgi:hypothetical protein
MASFPLFYVRVKNTGDLSDLHAVAEETNTKILYGFDNNIFTVLAEKTSKGDALQMANYFRETGKFVGAQPCFKHTWANGYTGSSLKSTSIITYITHIKPVVTNENLKR